MQREDGADGRGEAGAPAGLSARLDAAAAARAVPAAAYAWIAAGLALAAIAGNVLAFRGIPDAGFHAINDAARVLPDWLLANVTEIGNTAVLAALAGMFVRRRPQLLFALVLALLTGAVLISALKDGFAMSRPPAVLASDSFRLVGEAYERGSFPSGHTFATFSVVAVALAFVRTAPARLALLVVATVVGTSRVMVGVHWPLDVCAGAFGGLLTGALALFGSSHLRFGYRPAVHLAMVLLVLVSNAVLVVGGSNYPGATPTARLVAVVSTLVILWQYAGGALRRGR